MLNPHKYPKGPYVSNAQAAEKVKKQRSIIEDRYRKYIADKGDKFIG